MASGWAPDGVVQDRIYHSINDAVRIARAPAHGSWLNPLPAMREGIPEARRLAMPGARLCVFCQAGRDRPACAGSYNRRGSKDSQLR